MHRRMKRTRFNTEGNKLRLRRYHLQFFYNSMPFSQLLRTIRINSKDETRSIENDHGLKDFSNNDTLTTKKTTKYRKFAKSVLRKKSQSYQTLAQSLLDPRWFGIFGQNPHWKFTLVASHLDRVCQDTPTELYSRAGAATVSHPTDTHPLQRQIPTPKI